MCFIRRFFLALIVALATNPDPSLAQQGGASSAAVGASAPMIVVNRDLLLDMVKAAPVAGAASEVTLSRDQFLYLAGGADAAAQEHFVRTLVLASFWFVGVSLALILAIALLVRTAFWKHAAQLGPAKWRSYLMQLPLGAPEGSVRALLSLFVVVFGLLVLALQRYLNLGNVEAIAGFVGSVITFYFTARSSEQARKAALQGQEVVGDQVAKVADAAQAGNRAAVNNAQANANAAQTLLKDTVGAVTQIATNAVQASTQVAAASAPATDAGSTATASLAVAKDKLNDLQQVAHGVNALGAGADVLPNAAQTLATTRSLLDQIDPLLTGSPDPAAVTKVLQDVTSKLPVLEASGLPGVLAEAMQVIGDVATPVVAGLPGGPVGIVGGVLVAAIRLASDGPKLKDFQAAVLGPPFDPVLLPDTADSTVAPAVLSQAPLMSAHYENATDEVATQLMALAVSRNDDGTRRNAADLAAICASDIANHASASLPPRNTEFVSQNELMQAFDEYLSVLVRMGASAQLSGTVMVPAAGDGKPPVAIDLRALADAASHIVALPAGAAELERIVYLGEALGKLPMDPEKAIGLVIRALSAVAGGGLVQTEETKQ